jgi:peptidoglycan/xylan/chitin deacetylase (PgdA/CDA1 family)
VGLGAAEKHALAERLAVRLGVDFDAILRRRILHLMSEAETAEVSGHLTRVELHTHRHRTPRHRELFLDEIKRNTAAIQAATGRRPVHFCYPSGDYSTAFVPWLAAAGVVSATTGQPGLASRRSSPFVLPRVVDTAHLSSLEFEAWLTGFAALAPRRRTRVAHPQVVSAS